MDILTNLINREVEHDNVAYAPNATGNGAPAGPKYSTEFHCGSRLAGLETGPIPDRGPATSAGLWILVSFSTIFPAARIWLRLYQLKGLWWDNYILATHTISCILAQVAISFFGLGHYPCDIPNPAVNLPRINLVSDHFSAMSSMFAVALSKTSRAVTLLRRFHRGNSTSSSGGQPHQLQYRVWIVWFVIVTICLVKGAQGILKTKNCRDRRAKVSRQVPRHGAQNMGVGGSSNSSRSEASFRRKLPTYLKVKR